MLRRVGSLLSTALTAVVVLGVSTVAVVAVLIIWHGWEARVVVSGSMEPAIPVGALVLSRPIDGTAARVGDIIVFQPLTGIFETGDGEHMRVDVTEEESRITHRVIALLMDDEGHVAWLRTKGDANREPDLWELPLSAVEARVILDLPRLGAALSDGTVRQVGIYGAGMIGVFVLLSQIPVFLREIRRARRRDGGDESVQPAEVVAEPVARRPD